jgi:predicted dehydrogenase
MDTLHDDLQDGATRRVRLAIIGCGAVTRLFHVGAAVAAGLEVVALVDADRERAQSLAESHGVGEIATDVDGIGVDFDAAIVATPSHLHASIAMGLLERGIHVLVEKPMAIDRASAVALIETAERAGSQVHVGQMHRFFDHNRIVRDLLAAGVLGSITGFSMQLGMVAAWTTATSYATDRRQAGGGVLIDLGSHLLDLVRWWFGTTQLVSYRDDARGGVEAECEIDVLVGGDSGDVRGTLSISRLRSIGSRVCVWGTEQWLESDIGPGHVRLFPSGGSIPDRAAAPRVLGSANPGYRDAFIRQLEAFAASVRGSAAPAVPARDVLPTLELILRCYQSRLPLVAPWEIDDHEPGLGAR